MKTTRVRPGKTRGKEGNWPWWLAGLFFTLLALATATGKLPGTLLAIYAGASLLAFAIYYLDKQAARNNGWRTRESTLHLLALVGGWPGALIAQRQLRHKTAKSAFLTVFWASVLLNCAVLGYFLSASGGRAWRTLLGA